MDSKYEKINENTGKVTVTVEKNIFLEEEEAAYQQKKHKFNMPGFRKGHISKDMLYKTYGEGVFFEDAANFCIDRTYGEVVRGLDVRVLSYPDIGVEQIGLDKDFIYTATFAIEPDFELPQYKGVKYKETKVSCTDEDIEKKLKIEQEKNARIISVDREIKNGDTAVIDFEGFVDGKAFQGGKGENFNLVIGSHSFIDNFEDQLIGKKAQDEVEVSVKFPDDYQEKSLAGKPSIFKVKINEVKEKQLPNIDDEFISEISEFEKLDDYKKDLKNKILEEGKIKAIETDKNKIIDELLKNTKIDLSKKAEEYAIDNAVENLRERLKYNNANLDDFIRMTGQTMEQFRETQRTSSVTHLKSNLLLDKIAKVENISASDEQVDDYIKKMAEGYQMDVEKFKSQFVTDAERKNIKDTLLLPTVIDFIYNNAIKE